MIMDETITITEKEYQILLKASDLLDCLRACGVDNWNGYSDACRMSNEAFPEED
jgi:hypothetical protein